MPTTDDVAFFQPSPTMADTAVKIDGTSITPVTLAQMIVNHPNVFFTAKDENGVDDFCAHVPTGTSMTIEIAPSGGGSHIVLTSNIFVGQIPQHPPPRPS